MPSTTSSMHFFLEDIYLTSLLAQNLGEVAKADHRLASSSPVSVTGSSAIVYHKVSVCRKWEKKQHSLRIRCMFLLPCKTIGRCCGTHLIPGARIKQKKGCAPCGKSQFWMWISRVFLNIKNQSDWKHIHQEGLQQVSKAILKAAFNNKSTWHKINSTATSFSICSGFCTDSRSRWLRKNASVRRAVSRKWWSVCSTPALSITTSQNLHVWHIHCIMASSCCPNIKASRSLTGC